MLQEPVDDYLNLALLNEVGDDRSRIQPGDAVLLIVENDLGFARVVLESARERGFKGLVTSQGAAALAMARDYRPAAITLDIFLPDMQGWRVLDRLKYDLATRHIPVCVISTDESRERALTSGAMAFVAKPIQNKSTLDHAIADLMEYVSRTERRVLILEPDAERRDRLIEAVRAESLECVALTDAAEALSALQGDPFDCVIVGSDSGVKPGDLAQRLAERSAPGRTAVLVYGEDGGAARGRTGPGDAVALRNVQSFDRLVDQLAFVLHSDVAALEDSRRRLIESLHSTDKLLAGKRVLIVDDDMRNIFTLTAVLEEHDMVIISADNGRDAIRILQERPDTDIVLMDIMMPEMDGIDTIRAIRKIEIFSDLPIIAVTAKAMKGDREKCIEAGAWDYLAKPVDADQLLAALRAWLHR